MATKKKRTGLDALGLSAGISSTDTGAEKPKGAARSRRSSKPAASAAASASPIEKSRGKEEIAKTTIYAPKSVFEQWRELAFTERKKMHDYLLEGLDRVFADRGLKSIAELTGKE